jgi:hypothetical protein
LPVGRRETYVGLMGRVRIARAALALCSAHKDHRQRL